MTRELLLLSIPCLVALAVVISLEVIVAINKRKANKQDRMEVKRDEGFYEAFEFLKDDADELLNRKKCEQKTGMEKIKELKNRLANLAMTDDRPAVWRICRSLVESLDEIENEHFTEMEDLSHANTVLKAELDKANAVINEQMTKIQEADGEIKKLNARDEDRVSTIKGYQKDLGRLYAISAEKEKTIKEIEYERDVRGKAIQTLRKQLADAQEQVRAMSALANSAMGEAQTYRWRTAEPLFPFGVETHIDGATVTIGRDADGKLQQYGDTIVTIQMPHDVYTEQKAKFESQAKEIEALKTRLENITPEALGLTMTQCASIPEKRMRWERWERYVSVPGGSEWGS